MNKTLLKSVREYKKQSILAPLLVILEVLMEVLIPLQRRPDFVWERISSRRR